ncbi:hypothetical protein F5Y18DRAFT_440790 [Xylariaceae sp. FL1019]|nr:hypothetical protein F5Y18DRAFT_440790 [Xylariaceae sp. FL1019]
MESIKRFLHIRSTSSTKNRRKSSATVEGTFEKNNSHLQEAGNVTSPFTPTERGRNATIEFLNSGTLDSLKALLSERDTAAKQVRRGPKTKGTKEVQLILRQPSRKTVAQLHRACHQAGIAIKYGATGVVAYNFSKSFGWNQSAAFTPPLQLKQFGEIMQDVRPTTGRISSVFTPIDWLVLPSRSQEQAQESPREALGDKPEDSCEGQDVEQRCWTPFSEPGGWRDCEEMPEVFCIGEGEEGEEEDEFDQGCTSEALAVSVTSIASQQVRTVQV